MKNLVIGLVVILAIGGGIYYLKDVNKASVDSVGNPTSVRVPITSSSVKTGQIVPEGMAVPEALAAVFKEYNEETFAESKEKGRTLLFFSAAWCTTCRAAKQDISRNFDKLPKDLTILDLNYDTEKALKKQYGVFTQHTFVQIDKDGNEVTKWVGGGVSTILTNLEPV